jgi:hypothetical protein
VRDLLHDQIALQTAAASASLEHRRATQAIERRWQDLSADEPKYRSTNHQRAASA